MQINNLKSISQLKLESQSQLAGVSKNNTGSQFAKLIDDKLQSESVQFSKHAVNRMSERGLPFTEELVEDLNSAIGRARDKGAKDVVIIGPQSAFIVNVPNNTVITALNSAEMKENIFTNIDSALFL